MSGKPSVLSGAEQQAHPPADAQAEALTALQQAKPAEVTTAQQAQPPAEVLQAKPLVSVIIAMYNAEKYLPECLASLRACGGDSPFECILINDGSTDRSQAICSAVVSADPRFHLINKENSGVSESRNLGLSEAKGDYIFFLDADDFINAAKWPEVISYAAQGLYDMVAFAYYDLFSSGSMKQERFPDGCDVRYALLATTMMNTCWGKLLRREIIEQNGLCFRKELKTCEDAVFVLEFVQNAENLLLSNSCVLYYRIHSGGTMHRTEPEDKLSDFTSLYKLRCSYFSRNNSEELKKVMFRQFFSVVTDLFRSYAGRRSILKLRRLYMDFMGNFVVSAIMTETKIEYLSPVHKRFEFMMMSGGFYTFLAVYFKAKHQLKSHGKLTSYAR